MAGMAIDVLGPVRVESASLHPRERAVLAALVVRRGIPLAPEDLAEAIWAGAERPATWNKQVQQAVARLRKALGADHIATTAAGYHLDADPDEIDAVRFESLIAQARRHHLDGEPGRAVDGYRRALALWRGRPYDELSAWPEAVAAASDLEQLRVEAGEALLRARIDAGDALGVIPEAERLVRDEPLRESRWALLALALYRSGRQADALATLRAARERLADELGVDAGSEIVELEQAILQHDDALDRTLSVAQTRADCPYRGLGTYQESDADDFFGREREIATATRRLDETGLLVVTGASGSGKSSLVRAGVVPSLRRRGRRIRTVGPGPTVVGEVQAAVDGRSDTDVVVVDQFEEILEADAAAAAEVASLLAAFVADDGRAIITVRSDYLDACAADPSLAPLMAEGVLVVPPMDSDDLRRVIEAPAAAAGLRLEPGLIELILRDSAGAPGILPHLSHALAETWARREGPVLTVAGYEATGGIAGAIAQSADRLYQRLDPADQELCRSTLLRMVALAPDGLPVRRRLATAPLRAETAQANVFEALAHARLVSVEGDSVVLAHEALTRAWPRFRGWLQEGAEALAVLGHVESGAAVWDAGGRSDDDLARGARLQAMLEIRDELDLRLTATEAAFIDASAVRDLSERRALEAAADAERRQNRRLRFAITGVVGMLAIALVAGGLAVRSAVGESAAAEDARIDALVNEVTVLRSSDRAVAALLAAEAFQRWPDDTRSRAALWGMLTSDAGAVENVFFTGTEQRVGGAILPDHESALIVRDERHVEVRSTRTGEVIRSLDVELPLSGSPRRPFVALSADGRIATIVDDGVIEEDGSYDTVLSVVDVETGSLRIPSMHLDRIMQTYEISPDGELLAYIDVEGGDLVLIDLETGGTRDIKGLASETLGTGYWPGSVAFGGADAVTVGLVTGELLSVDLATLEVTSIASAPGLHINVSLTALEDGGHLATGHGGIARLDSGGDVVWRSDEDELGLPCIFHAVEVEHDRLFCGDQSGLIEERSLDTGERRGRSLEYQLGATGELTVGDDELLIMSAISPSIGRWRLSAAPRSVTEVIAPGSSLGGFDPDGRYLLLASRAEAGPDIEYTVREAATNESVLNATAMVAYWVGPGILRTVTPDRENYYIDVASGAVRAAPLHDHERSEEYGWAEPRPSREGTEFFDMACCSGEVSTVDAVSGLATGIEYDLVGAGFGAVTNADDSIVAFLAADDREDAIGEMWLGVFDTSTGAHLAERPVSDVTTIAMTSDGRIVAGGYGSLTVMNSELQSQQVIPAPPGEISALSISHDDALLAAGTDEWAVALYDLDAGMLLGEPISAADPWPGTVVELDPDGDYILVNMSAGVVRWSLDPDVWFEQVCRIAGRNLTQAEWDTHLSEIGEYRETCDFPTA